MGQGGSQVRVAVVANPFSGSRRNPRRVQALLQELRAARLEPVEMWQPEDLNRAAAEPGFAEQFRAIVVAGGDGTLHRVINTTTAVPLAHFPLGTENLFAAEFGHSADPAALAGMIRSGRVTRVDLGTVSYPPSGSLPAGSTNFAIVASTGFDAEVIHRLHAWRCGNPQQLRRVSRLSYLRPILSGIAGYRFPTLRIEADGKQCDAAMCMVFNLPRYGLGFDLCPHAVRDDGLLDYVLCERPGVTALIRYGIAARLGSLMRRPDVHSGLARQIRITSVAGPAPVELDGEAARFCPVTIEVLPQRLPVMVAPSKGAV
jgi:diacylglycerol kinase (ATP)